MKTRLLSLLALLVIGALQQQAQACPLCMGAQDGPTASAVNNAIFIMFGVLGVIFAGIGAVAFRFYLRMRRAGLATGGGAGFSHNLDELKEAEQNA